MTRTDSHDAGPGVAVEAAPVSVESAPGEPVELHVGVESCDLTREEARALRDALSDALTDRSEFVHTSGEHRQDGAYVVERRGADSSGHRKVFDAFAACRALYERLPEEFGADDVTAEGVTGGRRHMLVWHFAEHPAFECELAKRQPLTVHKRGDPAAE